MADVVLVYQKFYGNKTQLGLTEIPTNLLQESIVKSPLLKAGPLR